jgi:hypothetical protein
MYFARAILVGGGLRNRRQELWRVTLWGCAKRCCKLVDMVQSVILERPAVVRHGRRLEYFTITWNALEGLVAVVAGAIAGSILLVGFGIDSFIEVTSGLTVEDVR